MLTFVKQMYVFSFDALVLTQELMSSQLCVQTSVCLFVSLFN